jgi:hypothetical protein
VPEVVGPAPDVSFEPHRVFMTVERADVFAGAAAPGVCCLIRLATGCSFGTEVARSAVPNEVGTGRSATTENAPSRVRLASRPRSVHPYASRKRGGCLPPLSSRARTAPVLLFSSEARPSVVTRDVDVLPTGLLRTRRRATQVDIGP